MPRLRLVADDFAAPPTTVPAALAPAAASLDGRAFVLADEAGSDFTLHYSEAADLVWATYTGGGVRRGFLVGVRLGDAIHSHYAHIDEEGGVSGGSCVSAIEVRTDGRLSLVESLLCDVTGRRGSRSLEQLAAWGE